MDWAETLWTLNFTLNALNVTKGLFWTECFYTVKRQSYCMYGWCSKYHICCAVLLTSLLIKSRSSIFLVSLKKIQHLNYTCYKAVSNMIHVIEETLPCEEYKPWTKRRMGFWIGNVGKLRNIVFLDNQDLFFLEKILEHDLCILC